MRQQLDSFNEFICSNMQEIVDEYGTFVVKPEAQHDPGTPPSRPGMAATSPCNGHNGWPGHVQGSVQGFTVMQAWLSMPTCKPRCHAVRAAFNQRQSTFVRCAAMPKVEEKEYKIEFLQIYLSKPTITESDGETSILFPKEARLRSLT